ncbi:MAG: helix-turn-helix domain-containing protein [Candidatus Melainabacteria bacterium]|nr:helix-turn-helix domain-containing protein [Candidatus Melainabacteria bacterium]
MPAKSPRIAVKLENVLRDLGQRLRDQRKKLGISSIATAESAGMSRVTLYRIEQGEVSVAMGAYLSVIYAIGLELELVDPQSRKRGQDRSVRKLPQKIPLSDYPQLKKLAWQLKGTVKLSPKEALDLYERNWRHVDLQKMDAHEQEFLEALLAAFGRERLLV